MARPWDLTGDDIEIWSRRHDAPSVLGDLVRRLLLATSPISSISMSAHAGTRLRDWDGVVQSTVETAFCPAGVSIWELTVENDKQKLKADFDKRAQDTSRIAPGRATYVAVSARRVSEHERWAAERREQKAWKDVRLLHAEDLAAWLATAPAVSRWFAAKIGHPGADGDDLESYLDGWRSRARVRLPVEIAVAGPDRQQQAEALRGWARTARAQARPLRVIGDTYDEAAAFTAAALALDPSPEGAQVRARTLVVRSEEAMLSALRAQQAEPLLVIAAYPGAAASEGWVVLCLEPPAPERDAVRLSPVPYLRFAEILARSGMPSDEANRVARDSDGKLVSLQRILGYQALPRWADRAPSVTLSAMLLVGAFSPSNEADRAVLDELGTSAREVELLCERLRLGPDSPVLKEEGRAYRSVWTWRAPEDAWRALAKQIPADTLRRFGEVIRRVLGERDPALDLKPEERFAAALRGKSLSVSGALREGLTRSLVRLSSSDDALAPLHGPQRGSSLARIAVRELLPPAWECWASLSAELPLLAESAPETFLDCVEATLRAAESGVAHLLAEEARMGASPHTGLLWALETLGWDEKLMPRVASALARLAEHDARLPERPGKIANRPAASLEGLLRLSRPQTRAPAEVRIREMARRLRETPEVGFRLVVGQIARIGGLSILHPSRGAGLWPVKPLSDEEQVERSRRERAQTNRAYLELIFDHAGTDAGRWAYFLTQIRPQPSLAILVLDRLESVQGQIGDEHSELWAAVRHALHSSHLPKNDESKPEAGEPDRGSIVERWQRLYETLTPQDPVFRFAWLFLPRAKTPTPASETRDFRAEMRELESLRTAAIDEIGRRPDRLDVLRGIAEQVGEVSILGPALGRSSLAAELDALLLEHTPATSFSTQVPAYLLARGHAEGMAWLEAKVRSLLDQGRSQEVGAALQMIQASLPVWNMIDALGEPTRRSYWASLDSMPGDRPLEEVEFAVTRFVEVGNVTAAVKTAGWAGQDVSFEVCAAALGALVGASKDAALRFQRDEGAADALEKLMDRLEAAPDIDQKYGALLTAAELLYALFTFEPKRPMRRLSAALAADTADFVNLVTQVYRRTDEPTPGIWLAGAAPT